MRARVDDLALAQPPDDHQRGLDRLAAGGRPAADAEDRGAALDDAHARDLDRDLVEDLLDVREVLADALVPAVGLLAPGEQP